MISWGLFKYEFRFILIQTYYSTLQMEKQDNTFHYAKDGCVIEYNPNHKIAEKSVHWLYAKRNRTWIL